jgi:hypothetical protein
MRVEGRKHRSIVGITQDNDCRCHGINRKQRSRYNKQAKRQSARKARRLDFAAIMEQLHTLDWRVR